MQPPEQYFQQHLQPHQWKMKHYQQADQILFKSPPVVEIICDGKPRMLSNIVLYIMEIKLKKVKGYIYFRVIYNIQIILQRKTHCPDRKGIAYNLSPRCR